MHHDDDSFSLPVTIKGKKADYLFDTGAWLSVMTEPEAKRLGLRVQEQGGEVSGASGIPLKFGTVVVPEMTIGAMHFRNLSFAVIPHTAAVGIIGIPVLSAMGSIAWSKDGTVTIGENVPASPDSVPNLAFDRNRLLVGVKVLEKDVFATLDTGASGSDLNANFAKQFQDHVDRLGKKGTQEIEGVGGKRAFDSITLPELIFTIDRKPLPLRPAVITLQSLASMGGDCCIGNAGHDLLTQGQGFRIDFSTMTLRLR